MDSRNYVIGVLAILVLALAAIAVKSNNKESATPELKPRTSDLKTYYLYPKRCVNCDLNSLGQCDYCNSYYDERVLGTISSGLGVELEYRESDAVETPYVLIINHKAASLVDAKSRLILAKGLCSVLGGESCETINEEISKARACVGKYNISEDTIVYHYSTNDCIHCTKTTPFVESLVSEVSYNDTHSYRVFKAEDKTPAERRILDDCFSSFTNLDYVPQVICPKTGDSITGAIEKLSTLREFADKCVEAK